MSEENVVRLCAPTLAGIKTGSLFPCPYECRETLLTEIRRVQSGARSRRGSASCRCGLRKRARCCICTDRAIWSGICRTDWQRRSCSTRAMPAPAVSSV